MSNSKIITNGQIDYKKLIKQCPWIVSKKQKCILSPDSDGLLCGLLMQYFFDWEICGFYDGKVQVVKKGVAPNECVFLDMEIFRFERKSIGQHMLMWNGEDDTNKPEWKRFNQSINPNNIRGYDFKSHFKLKYPLGTVHLLLAIVSNVKDVTITEKAICPLLYTDGTFKCMFNYPDNFLSWLHFLGAENEENPLNAIFFNHQYSTSDLMKELSNFFKTIKEINGGKKGNGDKITISNKSGEPINLIKKKSLYDLSKEQYLTAIKFLKLLSELTGWTFKSSKWNFKNLVLTKFIKRTIKPGKARFNQLISKNPYSWAIIKRDVIEYTIENLSYKIEKEIQKN